MIKSTDLRIGNKVKWRGVEIFVLNILEDTINLDPGHPTILRRGLIPCSERDRPLFISEHPGEVNKIFEKFGKRKKVTEYI
jgi:hypothetical protein